MSEIKAKEKLNEIYKKSENIYYSTKVFEETKGEDEKPRIFPRELIKYEDEEEKHIWAIILKYKILGDVPQEVIIGTLGDTSERKEKAIEIINLIRAQLEENAKSEDGYKNYEKLYQYVKRKNIPFKFTIEGTDILFSKSQENILIKRTLFENGQGKIENLYDKEELEQMKKEKNSELNKYIKETKIIQKWQERREKILKSFDTEEKKQKFLKGEKISEFIKKLDEDNDIQKDITADYLLEVYDDEKNDEKENPRLNLLKGYLRIKEKGLSIDIKKILEDTESKYYKKIKEKEGEISLDDYDKLGLLEDYKTFFDLVKTAKDWNARVFALKLKKINFNTLKEIVQTSTDNYKELLQYLNLKEKMINEVQTDNIEVDYNEYDSVKELNEFLVHSSIREKTKEDDGHVITGVYEHVKREIIASNLDEMELYNHYAEKSAIFVHELPQNKEKAKEITISNITRKICEYIDKKNTYDLENNTKETIDYEEVEK